MCSGVAGDAELADLNGDRRLDLVITDWSGTFCPNALEPALLFIHVPKAAGM
jgi:hypothetical protein